MMQESMADRWDAVHNMLFIDIESTGINRHTTRVLEVAWAVGLDEPKSFLTHKAYNPSVYEQGEPEAFKVNGWFERWAEPKEGYEEVSFTTDVERTIYLPAMNSQVQAETEFVEEMKNSRTVVGANAAHFDIYYVQMFGIEYRIFDMGSYAAGKFGRSKPMGLRHIRPLLNENREKYGDSIIPDGNHTATMDVESQRLITLDLLELGHTQEFSDLLARIS